MKVVRRHMVPAEEVETVVWQCDVPGCDFEADDEGDLKSHFGKEHTVRATATILEDDRPLFSNKIELYWFEFEDHARKWLEAVTNEDYCKARYVSWSGPGWYFREYEEEPCQKGCCTHTVVDLENIEDLIHSHRNSAKNHLERADDIEKAVAALEKPCFDED